MDKIFMLSEGDEQGSFWTLFVSGYNSVEEIRKALKELNSYNYDRYYKWFDIKEIEVKSLRDNLEDVGWL